MTAGNAAAPYDDDSSNSKGEAEMADNTGEDDFYNDPATIGKIDRDINPEPDIKPPFYPGDQSQSILLPEKNTTKLDDRGPIDELEVADAADADEIDPSTDEALLDTDPTNYDPDSYHSANVEPRDEQAGEDV